MTLAGRIALVTGASRGIGKGIAKELCAAGATVYITGRTLKKRDNVPGSLEDTAAEAGANCIPVQCDHSNSEEIKHLFERIEKENDGRLDILVNNCYAAAGAISEGLGKKQNFFQLEPEIWDTVNNVGLRAHYFANVYAARLMTKVKSGVIIHISSVGSDRYLFNIAYGVGKAALNRLSSDCAHELKEHNVTSLVVSPGAVSTELLSGIFKDVETPEMVGKSISSLVADSDIFQYTGKVFGTRELYKMYNLNFDYKEYVI